MPGLGELKFYDVPGENFKAQDNLDDKKILFEDGFQALIDGASRSSTALENLETLLAKLERLVSKSAQEKYGSIYDNINRFN